MFLLVFERMFCKCLFTSINLHVLERSLIARFHLSRKEKTMSIPIENQWISEGLSLENNNDVHISTVAYEHPAGIPARFCAGLIPSIALSKQLAENNIKPTVRLIDPSSIANYCNGWKDSQSGFKDVLSHFLNGYKVDHYFDQAEQITDDAVDILSNVGSELESSDDPEIIDMVQRIRESGRKHGGELGAKNAILYMAAHPFSWLDMYHPSLWSTKHPADTTFLNLMSKPESRFTLVRKYLQGKRPDLSSGINSIDRYMTVCNTPCYIPLDGEPTFVDLMNKGYEWCHKRYQEIKGESGNHNRALKDFRALKTFVEG